MGVVYRARDPRLRRDVALKVLRGDLAEDSDPLSRFEREARAASALNHPNIITIYEIERAEGVAYIAMELVDGVTLREMLAQGRLDPERICDVGAQIADGLAKAHSAGIVHRDLKPENVMISRDGFVKILDFGIARRTMRTQDRNPSVTLTQDTEPGTVLGTASYMSPEQARGLLVDFRSDQFSFGAILYEMATGRVAFARSNPVETLLAVVNDEPESVEVVNPTVPERLSSVIRRCLKKKPDERYPSTRDIAGELRGIAVPAPPPEATAAPPIPPQEIVARPRRAGLWALAVVTLSVLTILVARSKGGSIDSLAVLPFETPSSDPESEYLGQGIADDLIQDLSRLPELRVIARSSVLRYSGQAIDPVKIGQELGVRAVLTGSAVQRGDRLDVSAELVDARRNTLLWGRKYDRRISDIVKVHQEIARDVGEQLRPRRASSQSTAPGPGSTLDPDAYRAYLKGRYHWNKRTEPAIRKAIDYFQQAIDKDPVYADAYAGLADANVSLGLYEFVPATETYPRAKAAAQRSIQIDETSEQAHASLGAIEMWYDWNWADSQREFLRMLELNPNYAIGRHWHADLSSIHGRHDEAIAEQKKALELDPLSLIINAWLGRRYYFARRYDDAARECRKTLELDPNFVPGHWMLGSVLLAKGKKPQARAESETAVRLEGENPRYLAYFGNALAKSGNAAGARAILDRLDALERGGRYVSTLDRALVHAGLGENDRALDWIEKAFADRPSLMPYLGIDPLWDGLRGSARFQAVLQRLGLAKEGSPASASR